MRAAFHRQAVSMLAVALALGGDGNASTFRCRAAWRRPDRILSETRPASAGAVAAPNTCPRVIVTAASEGQGAGQARVWARTVRALKIGRSAVRPRPWPPR